MAKRYLTDEERRLHRNAWERAYCKRNPDKKNMYMYKWYKKKVEEKQNSNVDYGCMWTLLKAKLQRSIKEDESFMAIPFKEQCFILQNAKILREMEKMEKSYGEERSNCVREN